MLKKYLLTNLECTPADVLSKKPEPDEKEDPKNKVPEKKFVDAEFPLKLKIVTNTCRSKNFSDLQMKISDCLAKSGLQKKNGADPGMIGKMKSEVVGDDGLYRPHKSLKGFIDDNANFSDFTLGISSANCSKRDNSVPEYGDLKFGGERKNDSGFYEQEYDPDLSEFNDGSFNEIMEDFRLNGQWSGDNLLKDDKSAIGNGQCDMENGEKIDESDNEFISEGLKDFVKKFISDSSHNDDESENGNGQCITNFGKKKDKYDDKSLGEIFKDSKKFRARSHINYDIHAIGNGPLDTKYRLEKDEFDKTPGSSMEDSMQNLRVRSHNNCDEYAIEAGLRNMKHGKKKNEFNDESSYTTWKGFKQNLTAGFHFKENELAIEDGLPNMKYKKKENDFNAESLYSTWKDSKQKLTAGFRFIEDEPATGNGLSNLQYGKEKKEFNNKSPYTTWKDSKQKLTAGFRLNDD